MLLRPLAFLAVILRMPSQKMEAEGQIAGAQKGTTILCCDLNQKYIRTERARLITTVFSTHVYPVS